MVGPCFPQILLAQIYLRERWIPATTKNSNVYYWPGIPTQPRTWILPTILQGTQETLEGTD